ncbi:hypothetical protein CCHR01_06951 [Colletotrichum chrysophilum]|uniref:BTB domain-containing protein n=1 Tax=Colletotrichum chrysophilum TaxID=1836956 RepID=A0AAD9AN02_9PEZI|nr:hypothetical protein CCHR01_06951 [Colletotrichum chrysophilum]
MDTSPTPTQHPADADAEKLEVVALHPSGDAIIVIFGPGGAECHGRFLVSSATLSLASSYFRTLFGPNFKEGADLRKSICPEIALEEDWPEEMGILLSMLHFHNLHHFRDVEPKTVALIAYQRDKYDCAAAIIPWGFKWFHGTGQLTDEQFGYLLTAAYLLDSDEDFRAISGAAIRQMTLYFRAVWDGNELIDRLPRNIKSMMEKKSMKAIAEAQETIYEVEWRLQEVVLLREPGFGVHAVKIVNCTADVRVADYFKALRDEKLWPPSCLTISQIRERTKLLTQFRRHHCDRGEVCKLKKELNALSERVNVVLKDIKGISLESNRKRKETSTF